ncbi:MAG: phenylalanine 4-monooxygenase [Pseudomonadota bacterium]
MTTVDFSTPPPIPDTACVAPLSKPEGLSADWVEPEQKSYSSHEHAIWRDLFDRQSRVAVGRACDAHQRGLEQLGLMAATIPELGALNERLKARSGWRAVPVPMLIPDHIFLYHLANRRFPMGNFIRTRAQFDYIEEPDVFHDCYGHIPLLADPVFAEYMQAFGKAGWKALQYNRVAALSTLYWFTVEFGLIGLREGELRAYGAGILSSPQELVFSLEGRSPNRIHLALERVMRTDYQISDLQQTYFVVESFDQLFRHTQGREFETVYETLPPAPIYANSAVLETDRTYHRGTQEYRLRGGRLSRAIPC